MTPRSSVAAIVLAHNDPVHVRRLINVLAPAPVFIHCDAATPDAVFTAMLQGSSDRVTPLARIKTWRGSWSLVQAEIDGVRAALERTRAEFIVLMSGSCYPLLSMSALEAELAATPGETRMLFHPLPHEPWGNRLGLDGGLWRLGLRFASVRGRPITVTGRPVPVSRARIPASLVPHGGSEWKIYAREHAKELLRVLDAHPELIRFFRTSFTPDESCVPSILNSPDLVGNLADRMVAARPWYVDFPSSREEGQDGHGHSDWLDDASFDVLASVSQPAGKGHSHQERALFARKFRSSASGLLDRIDAELHSRPA